MLCRCRYNNPSDINQCTCDYSSTFSADWRQRTYRAYKKIFMFYCLTALNRFNRFNVFFKILIDGERPFNVKVKTDLNKVI